LPLLVDVAGESAVDKTFETLYIAAFPKVYAFIRYQVSSTETAQELVSRVFLKAYKHRQRTPDTEPQAMQWIFRIAHTTLIDFWRVDKKRELASLPIDELTALPGGGESPDDAYERKQRAADMIRVIGTLSDDDRTMLALKFGGHRTNREIAAIMDLSEGAVSMRLLRALRRLRDQLQEMGWR
jgi:RNA polymerase sigma-70 factor (ECF subfamily)